jgi:hypothetical protein
MGWRSHDRLEISPNAEECKTGGSMIVATANPAWTALKNSQLIRQPPSEKYAYFGARTL